MQSEHGSTRITLYSKAEFRQHFACSSYWIYWKKMVLTFCRHPFERLLLSGYNSRALRGAHLNCILKIISRVINMVSSDCIRHYRSCSSLYAAILSDTTHPLQHNFLVDSIHFNISLHAVSPPVPSDVPLIIYLLAVLLRKCVQQSKKLFLSMLSIFLIICSAQLSFLFMDVLALVTKYSYSTELHA